MGNENEWVKCYVFAKEMNLDSTLSVPVKTMSKSQATRFASSRDKNVYLGINWRNKKYPNTYKYTLLEMDY